MPMRARKRRQRMYRKILIANEKLPSFRSYFAFLFAQISLGIIRYVVVGWSEDPAIIAICSVMFTERGAFRLALHHKCMRWEIVSKSKDILQIIYACRFNHSNVTKSVLLLLPGVVLRNYRLFSLSPFLSFLALLWTQSWIALEQRTQEYAREFVRS